MNNRNLGNFIRGVGGHSMFDELVSIENLHTSWNEFRKGKEGKIDVQVFSYELEENLFALHEDLKSGSYRHSGYTSFYITDPKLRHINKPQVRDRILHHALFRLLESVYEPLFIHDSYSSRKNKGTHKAIERLQGFAWEASHHNSQVLWALKCDIKKFFDSVSHEKLLSILSRRVRDKKVMSLLEQVVESFHTAPGRGIPLGNLTSQLFSNVYLDRLDQFVKRQLRIKHYVRYADDFVILSLDRSYLEELVPVLNSYLQEELGVGLHPGKVILRRWRQGVDFLGYVLFPHYLLLRPRTKRRIVKKASHRLSQIERGKISPSKLGETLQSFYGMLHHCRGNGIFSQLEKALERHPFEEGPARNR